MANYKKITDVEIMEEVSENSMALVNENGVLKQVPCAGFGGGSGNWITIVASEVMGDITTLVDVSEETTWTYSSEATYAELSELIENNKLSGMTVLWHDSGSTTMCYLHSFVNCGSYYGLTFRFLNNDVLVDLCWHDDNTIAKPTASDR